jgi:hypothetical protein
MSWRDLTTRHIPSFLSQLIHSHAFLDQNLDSSISQIMPDMNAIVVEKYGDIKNLVYKRVPKPTQLGDYDVLVQ